MAAQALKSPFGSPLSPPWGRVKPVDGDSRDRCHSLPLLLLEPNPGATAIGAVPESLSHGLNQARFAVEGNPAGRLPGQQRIVNVHQAKTHLSRLIDAAHGGETILLAKAGKPWARLAPLESEAPLRVTGRLRHLGSRSQPDLLLEPITPEELADWESAPAGPLEDGSLEDRSLAALE